MKNYLKISHYNSIKPIIPDKEQERKEVARLSLPPSREVSNDLNPATESLKYPHDSLTVPGWAPTRTFSGMLDGNKAHSNILPPTFL